MTTARRTLDLAMSEDQWQATIMDLAFALQWDAYHTHDSRGSQPGFPDLVLVRDRVIFAELKTERGRTTAQQYGWQLRLKDAGAETYIWRPRDYPQVEQTLRVPTRVERP